MADKKKKKDSISMKNMEDDDISVDQEENNEVEEEEISVDEEENEEHEEEEEEEEENGEDEEEEEEEEEPKVDPYAKNKTGVIYLPAIPYGLDPRGLRHYFSRYGEVGRIHLVPDRASKEKLKKNFMKNCKHVHYTEGWMEFKKKRIAKKVALSLNNSMIGGKAKCKYREKLWNLKYLHRFKWEHLTEKLDFERISYRHKMRAEISLAKKEAEIFKQKVEQYRSMKRNKEEVEEQLIEQTRTYEQQQIWNSRFKPQFLLQPGPDRNLMKSIFKGGDS